MKLTSLVALALAVVGLTTPQASAVEIPAGVISNGNGILGILNDLNLPPNLLRAVTDSPNAPGTGTEGVFNFDPNLAGAPGYGPSHPFQVLADQFRLEFDHGALGVNFSPVDHDGLGNGVPNPLQPVEWAITGNLGARTNSILRGSSLSFTTTLVGASPFTFDIEGQLNTDGLIHWYGDIDGDTVFLDDDTSTLASFGLQDHIVFRGRVVDIDDTADTTGTYDLYQNVGPLEFYFVAVPEPATLGLALMGGLFGAAVYLRRRWG